MSTPSSRSEFKQYCLRQLGAPVLEINLADEQCEDLIDDAIQIYNERHYDNNRENGWKKTCIKILQFPLFFIDIDSQEDN